MGTMSRLPGTVFLQMARVAAALALLIGFSLPGMATVSAQSTTTITIADLAFSPANVTVQAGDTVVFANNDSVAHTATANNGSFDTGTIQPGGSASVTFATAGTFSFFCQIHPSMTGSVTVQAVDDSDPDDPTDLPDTGVGPMNSIGGDIALILSIIAFALLLGGTGVLLRLRRS